MSAGSPLIELHRAYARSLAEVPMQAAASARDARPGAASGQRGAAEIEFIPWGLPLEDGDSPAVPPACEIIASFGDVEPEYAAIRRGAGLLDAPQRGTLQVTGKDRHEFLNRLVTQELKGFDGPGARQTLWLNRKGRIEADLLLIEPGGTPQRMLIDVDIANAAGTAKSLGEFIFTEDVEIRDVSEEFHHIAVHGRLARETVAAAANDDAFSLPLGGAGTIMIDGAPVTIARHDLTGEVGYELIAQRDVAARVWEFLLAADHIVGGDKRRVRPIGWHAFNIARIEAGTPLFNIDFGPTNLPHESGVLDERVSFTKGCYLGQEVVARMQSRGHSKAALVGLRVQRDLLPVGGAQVFAKSEAGTMGEQVGAITSSTLSPMLSAQPIAFAMIRNVHAKDGTTVLVNAEGEQVEATVGPLRFWSAQESKP